MSVCVCVCVHGLAPTGGEDEEGHVPKLAWYNAYNCSVVEQHTCQVVIAQVSDTVDVISS